MRAFLCFLLLLITGVRMHAAETIFGGNGVIAYLLDGDSWKTVITVVNLDDTAASFTLKFYSSNGNALSLTTNLGAASSFTRNLSAHGAVTIETAGTKPSMSQGWAIVETTATLGGTAIFRRTVPGQAILESSEPLDTGLNYRYALPFDHFGGSGTGLSLVNPSIVPASVTLLFRDEAGVQLMQDSFPLPALNNLAFTVAERYPQLLGKRGTFEISTPEWINALAVHVTPSGTFTAITPLVSWRW